MPMKEIYLGSGVSAIVDDDDYPKVLPFKWRVQKGKYTQYAVCTIKGKPVLMHRFILCATSRYEVTDHKNGNGLDNRKENIRICSFQENNFNKKGYKNNALGIKGVNKCGVKTWQARITHNKKTIYLGVFNSKHEAAIAYNEKAKELQGEFSFLNKV